MNVEIVAPGEDLVAAIADRVTAARQGSGADGAFDDVLVLLPGKRIGHFLRRELARRLGAAFAPPRISTLGDLVDELFARRHPEALPLARPIDAVALLHDAQLAADLPLGGDGFMDLDAFLPLGLGIFDALEDLLIEGVDPAAVGGVQALIEEGVPPGARERLATLRSFYERLYPALAAAGLSTRSSRIREVADGFTADDLGGVRAVVAAGFVELKRTERRLLAKIAGLPAATVLLRDGPMLPAMLEALGATGSPRARGDLAGRTAAPLDGTPASPRPAAVHFHRSPDAHGQVFALARLLPVADPGAVVVLPSPETLFPLVNHCLSRFDGERDYNISLQYPLTRTPLFGFFADLMQLAATMRDDQVYVPHYLAFLLHPYTKNALLDGNAEANRVLLHRIEERLGETGGRAFVGLGAVESDGEIFASAAEALGPGGPDPAQLADHLATTIHRETIGRFRRFTGVRDFIDRCIELVEWVHGKTTARSHPFFAPFAEQFIEALAEVRGSLLADRSFREASGYFALLRRYLASRAVPFEGTPLHGLQVLGVLETRGLRFERVFVLDANEGSLPAVGQNDLLLAEPVRRALGMRTVRDEELAARHHFDELAAGCRELHLFSVDDAKAEPSRFIERLLWERQREDRILDGASLLSHVRYRTSLAVSAPPPVAKTPEVAARLPTLAFSASALDAWLACPLRFYYARVLGLREKEEATGEVDRVQIGIVVHEAITAFLAPFAGRGPIEPAGLDPPSMDAIARRCLSAHFGVTSVGAIAVVADQVRARLGEWVTDWLRPLAGRAPLAVAALERTVGTTWSGWRLAGRIDALFVRDGRPWIVDWKTGGSTAWILGRHDDLDPADRGTWRKGLASTQLAMYLLLHAGDSPPLAADAAYVLLGKARMGPDCEVPLFDDRDRAAAAWPRIEETLRRMIGEIVDPAVPFAPADDLAAACPSCPFTTMCGTGGLARREENR